MTLKEQLNRLDWYQFEKLMALVFEQQGFSVQRLGGANADGGVDLVMSKGQRKQWCSASTGRRRTLASGTSGNSWEH